MPKCCFAWRNPHSYGLSTSAMAHEFSLAAVYLPCEASCEEMLQEESIATLGALELKCKI